MGKAYVYIGISVNHVWEAKINPQKWYIPVTLATKETKAGESQVWDLIGQLSETVPQKVKKKARGIYSSEVEHLASMSKALASISSTYREGCGGERSGKEARTMKTKVVIVLFDEPNQLLNSPWSHLKKKSHKNKPQGLSLTGWAPLGCIYSLLY